MEISRQQLAEEMLEEARIAVEKASRLSTMIKNDDANDCEKRAVAQEEFNCASRLMDLALKMKMSLNVDEELEKKLQEQAKQREEMLKFWEEYD